MIYPRSDLYPGASTFPSGPDAGGTLYVDAPTGTIAAGGALTDALAVAHAPAGSVAVAGALADALAVAHTPIGAIVLAGAITESWLVGTAIVYTDAPTGALVVAGEITESWTVTGPVYTDSPVGAIVLTGSLVELYLPPAPGLAVGHGIGLGLVVELTTLHYPDAPARVLAVARQFEGLEVAIPLNDTRTAKVTLGIYDDHVFAPIHAALPQGLDDLPYMVMLRVRYHGMPVFWGPVTVPNWRGSEGKVTLNAVGPELRLQHHFLKDGDPTGDGPLSESGKYPMTTAGLRLLRDAAFNEPADDAHGVPDLGIINGSEAVVPPELAPVPRLTFKRHDEIWRAMDELRTHELAPDMEIAPVFNVAGAYARLNCYFPQGTDRSGRIRLYYGFGPMNLASFDDDPGGKLITRQTYVSSDDKVRKRATAWASAAKRGIYGAVEPTDYDSTGDSVGEALTLRAKLEVRKYREPLNQVAVALKPEAAIEDPLRRYRYGRDFLVGDIVHVEARKGWLRANLNARITKVTLRQTDRTTVVPELELIPDIGDGSAESADGA